MSKSKVFIVVTLQEGSICKIHGVFDSYAKALKLHDKLNYNLDNPQDVDYDDIDILERVVR